MAWRTRWACRCFFFWPVGRVVGSGAGVAAGVAVGAHRVGLLAEGVGLVAGAAELADGLAERDGVAAGALDGVHGLAERPGGRSAGGCRGAVALGELGLPVAQQAG